MLIVARPCHALSYILLACLLACAYNPERGCGIVNASGLEILPFGLHSYSVDVLRNGPRYSLAPKHCRHASPPHLCTLKSTHAYSQQRPYAATLAPPHASSAARGARGDKETERAGAKPSSTTAIGTLARTALAAPLMMRRSVGDIISPASSRAYRSLAVLHDGDGIVGSRT